VAALAPGSAVLVHLRSGEKMKYRLMQVGLRELTLQDSQGQSLKVPKQGRNPTPHGHSQSPRQAAQWSPDRSRRRFWRRLRQPGGRQRGSHCQRTLVGIRDGRLCHRLRTAGSWPWSIDRNSLGCRPHGSRGLLPGSLKEWSGLA
jgi:hypothetical protein